MITQTIGNWNATRGALSGQVHPAPRAIFPASQFANARSVLGQLDAPCSSLISN
jgi:hypothetical protein